MPYIADATTVDLPALPDGWALTTELPVHLAFLHVDGDPEDDEYRRSIAVQPSGGPPEHTGWTAMGAAGYDGVCPRVARGTTVEEAVAAAVAEMQAVNDGEPSTDHADGVTVDSSEQAAAGAVEDVDEDDRRGAEDGDGSGDGQVGLDRWA